MPHFIMAWSNTLVASAEDTYILLPKLHPLLGVSHCVVFDTSNLRRDFGFDINYEKKRWRQNYSGEGVYNCSK